MAFNNNFEQRKNTHAEIDDSDSNARKNIDEAVDEESVIKAREHIIMDSDAVKRHLREHPDHKILFQNPDENSNNIDESPPKDRMQETESEGNKLYGPTIFAGACNCGQIKFEFHEDSHKVYGVKENVQVVGGYSANGQDNVAPGNYKTGGYSGTHNNNNNNSAYKRT